MNALIIRNKTLGYLTAMPGAKIIDGGVVTRSGTEWVMNNWEVVGETILVQNGCWDGKTYTKIEEKSK